MFGKKEGEVLCGADIHTPCVGYRTLALAKVEERFDEGKGLMERFAGRMTEMGIKRDEAWDEEAILADVVDERWVLGGVRVVVVVVVTQVTHSNTS